ncbi:NAD-dependent epimerase/dehydratase family protein [Amylibacter sp.]|nr:NAD-dependent epimerase/dehydratase family protein [Amylibacter sp.]
MNVLVTGANGFIGKNLILNLRSLEHINVVTFTREDSYEDIPAKLESVDWVFHLAGTNRPQCEDDFYTGNAVLTEMIAKAILASGRVIHVVFTSSIQVEAENSYGFSKRSAENALLQLKKDVGNEVYIYRLPNVFGKWARPNYNSVVATFCHNIARDIPIKINDPSAIIRLVYIDDVISSFLDLLSGGDLGGSHKNTSSVDVGPEYSITVGDLAQQVERFKASRISMITEPVGTGLVRSLYSTYVSYLPTNCFNYTVQQHEDERGMFVEMLKTPNAGQFSFFTAYPGVTRGGHFHHSKTEKFLVIRGSACFRFRHMLTGEYYELYTSGEQSEIVETVPGWSHDVTNVGNDDLICMLWANEIFDRDNPDTFGCPIV